MSLGFPGLKDMKRQTVRAPTNPMDKTTIVSILPKRIDEVKHTIQPGRFIIEAGNFEKPSILVVGPSSWWKEMDEDQPLLEIPMGSNMIANSVVVDYCNGILACNMGDSMPGLFYLPGEVTLDRLLKDFKSHLATANTKQKKWYETLVKMADTLWARTNGNPLTISDDMRMAAKELNLTHMKEWTKDKIAMEMIKCIACGAFKDANFPVCGNCKAVVDVEKATKLGLTFAK